MRLTVFTPTYNRRELLKRTYESLCIQTCRDFAWLIVDDGSSDDTKSLVEEWILEGKIEIRYHFTENGGKMRAHNKGVMLCDTDLFMCLDSDDWLTETAVSEIYSCIDKISDDGVAGIVAHKGKSETETLYGAGFYEGADYSTLYGLYLKGFKGETTLIYKTDILKKYLFPEIEGEKYVPEDYIYDKIDAEYTLFVLPKIITICELVESGYTDSLKALKRNNKKAWYLYYEQRAYITPEGLLKYKYLGYYIVYARRCGEPLFKGKRISPVRVIAGIPFAIALILTGREELH